MNWLKGNWIKVLKFIGYLLVFWYILGIIFVNIYCQFINPLKCIEHDMGTAGSWFELRR